MSRHWPVDPVEYDWEPHDPEIADLLPARTIPAWAATEAQARTTLFLLAALAIRAARRCS